MTRELTAAEIVEQATGKKQSLGSRDDFYDDLRTKLTAEADAEQPVEESRYESLRRQIADLRR